MTDMEMFWFNIKYCWQEHKIALLTYLVLIRLNIGGIMLFLNMI